MATMASCTPDPKELATKYLKEKRIMQLFEELGAYVVLEKPDNPEEFLITKLKEVLEARKQKEALTFFNEEDVTTMFSVFDTTGRGYVTPAQYEQALKNFGITKPKLKVPTEQRIGRKLFEANMLSELINKSITK